MADDHNMTRCSVKRLIFPGLILCLLASAAEAQRSIGFSDYEVPDGGVLAVPALANEAGELLLDGVLADVDARTGGRLAAALAEAGFSGADEATLTLYGLGPYSRIDVIGLGQGPLDRLAAEDFGGLAAGLNDGSRGGTLRLLWNGSGEGAGADRVAFGFRLGDYRFDRYQSERLDPQTRSDVRILGPDSEAGDRFESDLLHVADAVTLARDLASEPANVLYPESFVARIRDAFDDVDNVRIKVLDENDLERLDMGAHLGVGSGSRPPRLLVIEYDGGGRERPLVLAGKGITFDTGGISLKPGDNMWHMKSDMSGAAVVSATVLAAAKRGAEANLVALAALAENMPSGTAIRPGDVLTTMSGKTIEIKSTDAEGRLVLADAVQYAQREYEPDVLIDVATLTGSVGRALGEFYAGLFSHDDDLTAQLLAAGEVSGETLWRLPLDERYYAQNDSTIADVRNGGSGRAGASIGAAFIGFFIDEDQAWAHLDIAGVDQLDAPWPTVPAGYSAWGIRLLDQYIRSERE
jgi:leucyl aminopeptidase